MKVKRLIVQSFRGIDNLTLDFDSNITVLIGNNGAGKSTLLDCLGILFSLFASLVLGDNYDDSDSISRIFNARKQQSPLYSSLSDQDINNNRGQADLNILIDFNSENISWSIRKMMHVQAEYIYDEGLKRTTKELITKWQDSPEGNIPLVVHYSVNRTTLNVDLEPSDEFFFQADLDRFNSIFQLRAYNQALGEKEVTFQQFFKWFRVLEDLENEERRDDFVYLDRKLEAIRKAITEFLPGFSNLRVRRSPLRMTVQKQGQELIINQLSDGEKCLLAMVGDLARRLAIANPGLPDPLQGEGVVLIDEIELHLHPKWQRDIVPALTRTFPNCQFIVTTHSPQVLGEVKGKVYRLKSTSDGIIAESLQTYGRDSAEILEDEMEADSRSIEIKEQLRKLFRLIEDGDLEAARALKKEMAEKIGDDESEFVKAEILIRRHEVIGR